MKRKVAIVTGAGRGLGRAIAEKLASRGMDVALSDVLAPQAEAAAREIAERYGVKAAAYTVDVCDAAAVEDMVNAVLDTFGTVDVLVNNAGVSGPKRDLAEMDPGEWTRIFNVNLMGTANCIRAVLPIMKENRAGRIINLASLAGEVGVMAVSLAYGASKAAVINLTKSLAKQLGPYQINVNCVAPGYIKTDMTANNGLRDDMVPLGRLGEPEDVAGPVAFLAGEDAAYLTGVTLDVNGGVHCL